jgi:hypothetical protein
MLPTASASQNSSCEEARKQCVTGEQIRPAEGLATPHGGLNLAFLIRRYRNSKRNMKIEINGAGQNKKKIHMSMNNIFFRTQV